jgi:hypothetical protein
MDEFRASNKWRNQTAKAEEGLIAVTADVKTCPHNYVFIDQCCACLIDMLKRILGHIEHQFGDSSGLTGEEDIKRWWVTHADR